MAWHSEASFSTSTADILNAPLNLSLARMIITPTVLRGMSSASAIS